MFLLPETSIENYFGKLGGNIKNYLGNYWYFVTLGNYVAVTANVSQSDRPVKITAINDPTLKIVMLSSRRSRTTSESPSFIFQMSSGEFVG